MDELLFQVIYANEDVHAFLLQFFHDEITDPTFQEELARETAWNYNERWNLSRHMSSFLLEFAQLIIHYHQTGFCIKKSERIISDEFACSTYCQC